MLKKIMEEVERQEAKWDNEPRSAYCWITILAEEVGEVARAALQMEFAGGETDAIERELVQVAAIALMWHRQIVRERSREWELYISSSPE